MERRIKRYSNRKLYDLTESRYVSLQEVAVMIQRGESVRITDKDEAEDWTAAVLAQIIAGQAEMPASILHDIIRWNSEAVDKSLQKITGTLENMGVFPRDETDGLVESCNDLNKKIDRLEHIVDRLEKCIKETTHY